MAFPQQVVAVQEQHSHAPSARRSRSADRLTVTTSELHRRLTDPDLGGHLSGAVALRGEIAD